MYSKLFILLAVALSSASAFESLDLDYYNGMDDTETIFADARTFNISLDGLGNSSLLTIGAVIIIGIILFEVALYALDVYYNQTYGFGGNSGGSYGQYYANKKIDLDSMGMLYGGYPKYPDAFSGTFRGLGAGRPWSFDKIIEKIQLAREAYELSDNLIWDLECQKKVICELYSQGELGELGRRGRHGLDYLDYAPYLSLPEELRALLEEYEDARSNAKSDPAHSSCDTLYSFCPVSLKEIKQKYNKL